MRMFIAIWSKSGIKGRIRYLHRYTAAVREVL